MIKLGKIPWFTFLRLSGVVLFVIILWKIDFNQSWQILKTAKTEFVLIAILSQVALLLLKSHRWFLIRRASEINIKWTINAARFLESYAIGVFTPGRLGEFVKAGHEKVKEDKFLSIIKIFYERGFDVGVFALISGLFFFYFFHDVSPLIGFGVITGGLFLLIVTYLLMTADFFRRAFFYIFSKVFRKISFSKDLVYEHSTSISIFALSILSNLSYFSTGYFLAVAVGINESFLDISGIISVTGMLNLLPITIMGMGTREVSFLYFLPGYTNDNIIAFSMLMFLIAQIGGAVIAFLMSQLLFFKGKNKING
jgi:uncharacterized protein (TIRG00374 family)